MPTSVDPYVTAVLDDNASNYWRLNSSGTTQVDYAGSLNQTNAGTTTGSRRPDRGQRPGLPGHHQRPVRHHVADHRSDDLHGRGVVQDHDHLRRQDRRLRRQLDRQLRQLRPARLHGQLRPDHLRRLPGWRPDGAQRQLLQRRPVAPRRGLAVLGRHAALPRRAPGRRERLGDRRPGVLRLLADRRGQPQRLAEQPEQLLLQRQHRRGRDLPDRAERRADPGPLHQVGSHPGHPAGADRRVRPGRLQRRPGALLAAERGQRDDRGRRLAEPEQRHLPGRCQLPDARAPVSDPPYAATFNGNDGFVSSNTQFSQPEELLRGGLVQDHLDLAVAS